MATWKQLSDDLPEFTAKVREVFDAGTNKTIATLRKDGSPRISGTELQLGDDDVMLGMMGGSLKLLDVRRDPRVAIHSPTLGPPPGDPTAWSGDAKISGRLVAIDPPAADAKPGESVPPSSSYFAVDINEVVFTRVGESADHLVIESWTTDNGVRSQQRY